MQGAATGNPYRKALGMPAQGTDAVERLLVLWQVGELRGSDATYIPSL